jgi:hypothetical protein
VAFNNRMRRSICPRPQTMSPPEHVNWVFARGMICTLTKPEYSARRRRPQRDRAKGRDAPLPARRGSAVDKPQLAWRGGRVVEGARLESVYTGNRIAGSNPAPSASQPNKCFVFALFSYFNRSSVYICGAAWPVRTPRRTCFELAIGWSSALSRRFQVQFGAMLSWRAMAARTGLMPRPSSSSAR